MVIEMYTGTCMLTGDDRYLFYDYARKLYGRPVYTHELPMLAAELKELAKEDFIRICENLTDG